jgi:DNA topoisomerase-1|tara:strand:- start:6346 stop:8388 length:2043 start_codon:yes stop_codon:yes gene_type:complete
MKTLIITEKPKVSQRIANALFTKYSSKRGNGVTYYEKQNGDEEFIVASAAGHLYSLSQKGDKWDYPLFEIGWRPIYEIDKSKSYIKKYIRTLISLAKNVDEFYLATDYDIEGELLGYNALRFACSSKGKKIRRMKFSTLTKKDLLHAFENPGEIDWKLVDAGEARHMMDWYWGINTSRALTKALKSAGHRYVTISAGRVQTPALSLLVDREKKISEFTARKYWEIFADLLHEDGKITVIHDSGRVFEKDLVDQIIKRSKNSYGTITKIDKKKVKKWPPFPFNLGALQSEAYRCFKFSPKSTQQMAQKLYEGGCISYPRTSSEKLPPAIGYRKILSALKESIDFKSYIEKILDKKNLRPIEGKKIDPAHPAIFPTGRIPKKLDIQQQKLYKLIVHRFIATFGIPMIREELKGKIKIQDNSYNFSGVTTIENGWATLYPFIKFKEQPLPYLANGDNLNVERIYSVEKETKPPPRYNPSSLVRELEKHGLGTKATRADIVETLYRREYIKEVPIQVTELGVGVVRTLEENAPAIISEKLTRLFEDKVERIRKGMDTKTDVLSEAREELKKILDDFREKETHIGVKLSKALVDKDMKKYLVGPCPTCKNSLKIIKSRKTGKIFVGCNNYPKCSTSYPLPQNKLVKTTNVKCNQCNLPMVSIKFKKTPILSCIDINCKSKKKRFG